MLRERERERERQKEGEREEWGFQRHLLQILDFMSGRGGTLREKHGGRRDLRERGRDSGRGSGCAGSVFKSYTHHCKGPARFRSMGLQTTVRADFTVMASNPENEPRALREVEKPLIKSILPPTVEEMHGQNIWNNCVVRSVVSGVMDCGGVSMICWSEGTMAVLIKVWWERYLELSEERREGGDR
ncbi:hypothetical protein PS1_028025 [Malus domestica]